MSAEPTEKQQQNLNKLIADELKDLIRELDRAAKVCHNLLRLLGVAPPRAGRES